jgi:class 3 adenylate cyclase/DNA-binding CsgD family transcriptional regulator
MPALPTGTVTFLFTDVEGSTRLWELFPDQMRAALARHDALIEGMVKQHQGVVVRPRGEGDSRFAVFPQASDGVAAACAIQVALHAEPWPPNTALWVRLALHTGEAGLRQGDYYGTAVNRCARLRAIAHGGQSLLSEATAALVRERLPEGASLVDLGAHRLRDLARPERVFQLRHPALPDTFPPLAASGVPSLDTGIEARLEALLGGPWPSRLAGISAGLAALCIVGTVAAAEALSSYNQPGQAPATATVGLVRWWRVLGLLGYYLLLVPPALHLRAWLRPRNPGVAGLATTCGLAYALIGGGVAAVFAAAEPIFMQQLERIDEPQREGFNALIRTVAAGLVAGVLNILVALLGGVWWTGMGALLWPERRALGVLTITLGGLCLLHAAGTILGLRAVANGGGWGYLFLTGVWTAALAIDLLRLPAPLSRPALAPAPAGRKERAPAQPAEPAAVVTAGPEALEASAPAANGSAAPDGGRPGSPLLPQPPARERERATSTPTGPLTPREQEIAALIAEGLTNRQIAHTLVIAPGTADRHVANILGKLGVTSRAQVAAWVVEQGLPRRGG